MQANKTLRVTFGGVLLALSVFLGLILPSASNSQAPITSPLSSGTQTRLANDDLLLIDGKAAIWDPITSHVKPIGDLTHPRSWHTATLLPDATVLIVGGIDEGGSVVTDPEIFDPEKQTFESVPNTGLSARAYHSATLLTDGTVLLAGGVSLTGTPVSSADIWDFRTRTGRKLEAEMLSPRVRPTARLLSDGSVLLSGGVQDADPGRIKAEVYSPSSHVFQPSYAEPRQPRTPTVEGSMPENRATEVATDAVVGVRFSSRMQPDSLSAATVALLDDSLTRHDVRIVTAEQGMLLFVAPKSPLAPSTSYLLAINGAKDLSGNPISYSTLTFTTATAASLQENRLLTTSLPSGSTYLRPAVAPPPDPPAAAASMSIKAFINCLNMTLVGDGKDHTVSDTVPPCIPGQAVPGKTGAPICQFEITMSPASAQSACSIKNNAGQFIQFPRVILDCPGATAPLRFRPSYTLCPGTLEQNQLDHIELAYDLTKVITFENGGDVMGPANLKDGFMMMGDIMIPRNMPLPNKLVFGPGNGAVVSFYTKVGDDQGSLKPPCASCHVATFAKAPINVNTVVPFPPLNPFDNQLSFTGVMNFYAFTVSSPLNLASFVISTNNSNNATWTQSPDGVKKFKKLPACPAGQQLAGCCPPGTPAAGCVLPDAQNTTAPFTAVCAAIKANIKTMTNQAISADTMMVSSNLCQNLLNVVDLGK